VVPATSARRLPSSIFVPHALHRRARRVLVLSHMRERPGWYVESRRFDTMPSRPSRQACSKTVEPSVASMCSTSWMPVARPAQQARQRRRACHQRVAAQVHAVELPISQRGRRLRCTRCGAAGLNISMIEPDPGQPVQRIRRKAAR
jgi:hypothetical protein